MPDSYPILITTTEGNRQTEMLIKQLASWKHCWWTDRPDVILHVRRGMVSLIWPC